MPVGETHIIPVPLKSRYHGVVHTGGADGRLYPVTYLIDSGNDISILTRKTADKLGFNADMEGELFFVKGISGPGQEFRKFVNIIKIGDLTPMKIRMGMAVKESSLAENLLGRQDVFDSGRLEIIYDEDSIEFREKHGSMHLSSNYAPISYGQRRQNYTRKIMPLYGQQPPPIRSRIRNPSWTYSSNWFT